MKKTINLSLGRIKNLFAGAKDRIVIISAFIGSEALNRILASVPKSCKKTIYVRWRLQDICAGATDHEIYGIAQQFNADLLCHNELHAKAYIADNRALVGSANATSPGLGIARNSNLELLVETSANSPNVIELLNTLNKEAMIAKQIPSEYIDRITTVEIDKTLDDSRELVWVPRSPYLDVFAFLQSGLWDESAASDCINLGLSIGASEDQIKLAVNRMHVMTLLRERMLETTVGMKIDDLSLFLTEKTGKKDFQDVSLCLRLLDWIHHCSKDMHVIDADTERPILTPWTK